MSTGYTCGIVNGKVKTFPEFAKLCMRAFGATIHMKEDNLDKEYEPRVPSNYYIDSLNEAKKRLDEIKKLSNDNILNERKNDLLINKAYHNKRIKEIKELRLKLEDFLKIAKQYKAPTKDHEVVKAFMIKQIIMTIDADCDDKYHHKQLVEIDKELKTLDIDKIRKSLIQIKKDDIKYYTKQYKAEIKRCADSNKWVEQFIKSLEKVK